MIFEKAWAALVNEEKKDWIMRLLAVAFTYKATLHTDAGSLFVLAHIYKARFLVQRQLDEPRFTIDRGLLEAK